MHYPPPSTPTPRGTSVPRALSAGINKNNTPLSHEAAKLIAPANRTFLPGWTCSTHVFQAATPRETPPPEIASSTLEPTKAERRAWVEAKFEKMKTLRDAIALDSKKYSNNAIMWIAVNRYAPDKPRASNAPLVTLVVSHALGFHKEIWEATFRHLLSMIESDPHQLGIDEIWAMDTANHGDSALLNKPNLGNIFEWSDHTRDILNFVINFLPESIYESNSTSLPQAPEQVSQQRREHGFRSRTIVGLGHSFGACTLVRALVDSPNLFSSAILVDPVIHPSYSVRGARIHALTKGALARRNHWPNRETAKAWLLKSPFFQAWHPEVLADYVTYGMYEFEGGVRLKCSGYQEAAAISERGRLQCETWELLPSLDERIHLKWIMDSTNAISTGGEEITQHTVWRRPVNSSNVRIQGARHLIPHEAPQDLAREILDFIHRVHGNWPTGAAKSKL